jgi:hypothetical protein
VIVAAVAAKAIVIVYKCSIHNNVHTTHDGNVIEFTKCYAPYFCYADAVCWHMQLMATCAMIITAPKAAAAVTIMQHKSCWSLIPTLSH